MELKKLLNDLNQNVNSKYDQGRSQLLDSMGLQEKRSATDIVFPMIGVFGAGLAVGATLGLLFAPKRGDALRHEIRDSLEDLQRRSKTKASQLVEREHSQEGNGRDPAGTVAGE